MISVFIPLYTFAPVRYNPRSRRGWERGLEPVTRALNRLSDRRVKTAKPGLHCDGGGLYLQATRRNRSSVFPQRSVRQAAAVNGGVGGFLRDAAAFRYGSAVARRSSRSRQARLARASTTSPVHGFRDWAAERTNFPSEVAERALAHTVSSKVDDSWRHGGLSARHRRKQRRET
jgi:hypothetical protein